MKLNNLKRTLGKTTLKLKKHSPAIFLTIGVVGTVASAVMACRETLKVDDILNESRETLKKIKEVKENKELSEKYDYTEEEVTKDIIITYLKTAGKLIKLYAPAVILGTFSISCIIGSHNLLNKRNVALAASYATISESFKGYRERVKEVVGKSVERDIRYGIKNKEVEETITDKKGKDKTITTNVAEFTDTYSDFAKFFDSSSIYWEKDPSYNLMFLKAQQKYANDKLKLNGYLFLNDVYESLGLTKTKAGQIVGWIYDESNPIGDNYVDFGIYDPTLEGSRRFVNNDENVILLDFNVDGDIWSKM